jgi:hypothetical protein
MTAKRLTKKRIDELLAFLPILYRPPAELEPHWLGGGTLESGVFVMPHPAYPAAVEQFFAVAGQEWWCDFDYRPETSGAMVRSDDFIAKAILSQIKTMLTFCVRGERFCDGHWTAMIEQGRVAAILKRLAELRKTMT